MSSTASFRRNPLVISGNSLASGDHQTTFSASSPRALLRSYLIFVRDMRGQRREPSIELRTEDVAVIAGHLGVSEEFVLGGLLDLMGATRAQRSTMMAMLAAGALTIVLTGSFVSDLSSDGVSVEMSRLADAVQAAVGTTGAAAETETAAPASADRAASVEASTLAPSRSVADAPATPATPATSATPAVPASSNAVVSATPTADVLRSAATGSDTTSAADAATAAPTSGTASEVVPVADEPVSVGVSPDGSVVASVAPPVPAAAPTEPVATAELPDGTTVGVAAPPVPPSADEQVATGELPDGTTVGVAVPPVPPVPEG